MLSNQNEVIDVSNNRSINFRDDLSDGGSSHIAATIQAIKKRSPKLLVECLAPDFAGNLENAERSDLAIFSLLKWTQTYHEKEVL